MKWYNNGWYPDTYDKGAIVDDKTYCDLMNKHCCGEGELHTDENGFPFLAPHIVTSEEEIILAKEELSAGDYQVIKELEKIFLGDSELHKIRQALRDKINKLESKK